MDVADLGCRGAAGRRGAGRDAILTLSALDQGSTRLRVGGKGRWGERQARFDGREDAETAASGPFRHHGITQANSQIFFARHPRLP